MEDKSLNKELEDKFLSKIYSNSLKLSQIIDKLRLSLRLQEKNQELQKTKVNLYNLAENCASDLKIKYKNQDIKIEKKIFL